MADYDRYLETLAVVRRRASMLNIALGDRAPGLLVHSMAQGLYDALTDLMEEWDEEFAEYAPRVPEDPMTREFKAALSERLIVPDDLEGLDE